MVFIDLGGLVVSAATAGTAAAGVGVLRAAVSAGLHELVVNTVTTGVGAKGPSIVNLIPMY